MKPAPLLTDDPAKALGAGEISQSQKAYQLIEEMIVTSTLAPGSRVSEKGLSSMLGLGRTPIREALQRLAMEGTVAIMPRAGVIVADIDLADQFRLIEVRRELEKILAGRSARLSTQEERAQFERLAAAFIDAAQREDAAQFITTDREFNTLVANTARNKYALLAISPIQSQTRRFWYLYFKRFGDLAKVCRLHAAIASCIASGDETAARAASDDLIDYVEEYTRRTLQALM